MDVWNYILGYRNTLKSVFETWVVHTPFKSNDLGRSFNIYKFIFVDIILINLIVRYYIHNVQLCS